MPYLSIHMPSIVENLQRVKKTCDSRGYTLLPVTKVCLSEPVIVDAFAGCGIGTVADSSLACLSRLQGEIKRFLLKIGLHEARNGGLRCDCLYTSSMEVLESVSERNDGCREVFLALELGDLREGILPEELPGFIQAARALPNIEITGLGANFGCLMGKLPDGLVAEALDDAVRRVRRQTGFEFEYISFGGTAVYPALVSGTLPDRVNHVRIGEAIFFGYNLTRDEPIEGLIDDAFVLSGEILEVRNKRVDRWGVYGLNAFGEEIRNGESGFRKRAVLDFGELGAPAGGLTPLDDGVRIIGSTHDYTVVDISSCSSGYRTGGFIDFKLNYTSAARAFISPEIENRLIKNGNPEVKQ